MADNPLKYSDLLIPDDSIKNAIQQLKELNTEYDAALGKIKGEAAQLQKKLTELNTSREDQQEKIKQISEEAAKLSKKEADLTKAQAQAELALQKVITEKIRQEKLANREKKNNKITTKEALELATKEVHSINEANEANRRLRIAVRQLTDAEDKEGKIRAMLNSQIQVNTNYIRRNTDAMTRQKMNIGNYTESIKQAFYEIKKGNASMKNLGIVARGFGGLMREQVGGGLREVTTGVKGMVKGFVGAQLVLRGITALTNAIKSGTSTIIDFQAANSKLAAILGTTADKIGLLRDDALRLGAATSFTAAQVTSLQTELAKLGFTQREILLSTSSILKFAKAVDTDLGSAAAVAGAALRAFGADASEMARYVSVMAVATTKSALSFSDLESSLSTVAPVAKSFGFTIEDTVTLFGALKNAGFDASSAATATRNILLNLADANGKLAKSLGQPVTSLANMASAFAKLRDSGIDLAQTLELTDKRSVAAFNSFLLQADSLAALRDSVTDVNDELNNMSEVMGDNVAGSIKKLESAWEGLVLTFSNSTGTMKNVIDFLAKGVSEIAFRWKSVTEQNKQLENEAIAAADETMVEYNVISERLKSLQEEYKRYQESGMSAADAAAAAKKDMVDELEQEIERENKLYEEELKKQKKLQEDYENASFIKQGLFLEKSNAQYEEAIRQQGNQLARIAAERYKAQAKLDAVTRVDLTGDSNAPKKKKFKLPDDKKAQTVTKKNNDIRNQLASAQTSIIKDDLEKQRKMILDAFQKQKDDLMNKYNYDKDLTEESRENIRQIILFKEQKLQQDLADLQVKGQANQLELEQKNLNLRLAAVEAGSEAENEYRMALLENQRKQELLKNSQLTEKERMDEALINAKYDKLKLDEDRKFQNDREMLMFDQQQELEKSEFEILKHTEEEKTRFRLEAEKKRWEMILKLNETSATKMSDVEVQTIKNIISKIDNEISESKGKDSKDIYDIVGLKLDDDQKQAISQSVGFSIGQLQSVLDAQVQIKEKALEAARQETEAAQNRVDKEIEARNNGYANDVVTAQKELEQKKKNEEKALKEKQKAQKQQQALDTLTQTSSLITASAQIWKSLSGIPVVGVALALAGIATMWTSFAASKIKARQASKQEYGEGGMEFLSGGSHQSGNDIDMGTTPDGRKRRAEGGESFAIINKTSTRKYRGSLPGIIKALNNGTFENKYLGAFNSDGVSLNINGTNFDSKQIEKDVREIKEQNERRFYVDSKTGKVIEVYKNLTRVIN